MHDPAVSGTWMRCRLVSVTLGRHYASHRPTTHDDQEPTRVEWLCASSSGGHAHEINRGHGCSEQQDSQPAAAGTLLGRRSAKRGESSFARTASHARSGRFVSPAWDAGEGRGTHTHRCNSIRAPRPGSADRRVSKGAAVVSR